MITNESHQFNRTCFCTIDDHCDSTTKNSCQLIDSLQMCYQSWTKQVDGHIVMSAGCIWNDFFITNIFCSGNHSHRVIICCSDEDFCNDRDQFSRDIRSQLNQFEYFPKKNHFSLINIFIFLLVVIFLTFLIFIYWKRRGQISKFFSRRSRRTCSSSPIERDSPIIEQRIIDESQTGETSFFPEPVTFARQTQLREKIGSGAYGCVYKGLWRNESVAVKIFFTNEAPSFYREVELYKTSGLNHEHILRYITSDIRDASMHTELWLVTEYHPYGSLSDYLRRNTITIPTLIKMMYSIASGLCHLHTSIESTDGKTAIAHRDLKSKNILVKKDLSCCIADLGLAVREVRSIFSTRQDSLIKQEKIVIDIKQNHRVGTYRYMAPEILSRTFNDQLFESYKAADMYALGLIYWELLRRCQIDSNSSAEDYQLPYDDVLDDSPTFENMFKIVCIDKHRPIISERWQQNSRMVRFCEELWLENAQSRLNSYQIRNEFDLLRSVE